LGFLAGADHLASQLAAGAVAADKIDQIRTQVFNLRLDAVVTGIFMVLVALIVVDAARVWIREVRGPRRSPVLGRGEGGSSDQSWIRTGVPTHTMLANSAIASFSSEMQPQVQSTRSRFSHGLSVPWMPTAPPTPAGPSP